MIQAEQEITPRKKLFNAIELKVMRTKTKAKEHRKVQKKAIKEANMKVLQDSGYQIHVDSAAMYQFRATVPITSLTDKEQTPWEQ